MNAGDRFGTIFLRLSETPKTYIMTTMTEEMVEVLNDLIRINNDRIEGYERAAEESKDIDITLKTVFNKMADESRKNVSELTTHVNSLGGDSETGTTAMGKIYRAWMDVKAAVTGKDRHAILASCEYGEDQAQKAYDKALASDAEIDAETRQIITSQKESLKASHDNIKQMRDASK
jgi:uncharacterized protein (TIGR02284 family)